MLNEMKLEDELVDRIYFYLIDKFRIIYPPEEVVCNLCGKVVKFKDMSEHRRYCPPADWRIPMEGDKDEVMSK